MSKRELLAVLVILALIVTSGCSGDSSSPGSTPGNGGSAGGATGVFGTGVIKGKVTFEGDVPAAMAIKMEADAYCEQTHADGISRAKFVVDASKGLKWVFVHVKEGLPAGKYATPSDEVVIDQKGCQYAPHVFGIMPGQTLKILNSDNTSHNIHSKPKKSLGFNSSMPKGGIKELKKGFKKAEVMVRIICDVHSWMEAFAGVVSHPFHSTTGDDGSFSLDRLPKGTYTIEAWHEGATAPQTQSVTVGDGETKEINFSFKAP